MFKWYGRAGICYAYLEDVPRHDDAVEADFLLTSRWFQRGWTLQELIAPRNVQFYANDWSPLGAKSEDDPDFTLRIANITGIDSDILLHRDVLSQTAVSMRMSWAADRETTREEDRAYSLMGIFDVHMPILYGEGLERAFERLQIEIMTKSPDQSIFAWKLRADGDRANATDGFGLLAASPSWFRDSRFTVDGLHARIRSFSITNIGIQITLSMNYVGSRGPPGAWEDNDLWVATLRCLTMPYQDRVQIYMRERRQIVAGSGLRVFERVHPHLLHTMDQEQSIAPTRLDIHVPSPDQMVHLERAGCVFPLALG
jgi:hypothetical protein